MINKKLKAISSFIKKDDVVLDIGCDHAYLSIYLKMHNLCKEVFASDININALNGAIKNINNSGLNIKAYLSDGFKNIDNPNINTAVISGMGASSILEIVDFAPKNINKFIICSNNDHEKLRVGMLKHQLYLQREVVIKDKNKYYLINEFTKNKKILSKNNLKYGIHYNKEYLEYLILKEKEILKNIPYNHLFKKITIYNKIRNLKKLIRKI